MRTMLALLAMCVLAVVVAGPASATLWTVSTVAQLQSAVNSAQPGDIIELTDGTYTVTAYNGILIQDKNNLTLRSQSGNRDAVIVKGQGINDRDIYFTFQLVRSDYITLENMTLRDTYYHCVQLNEGSSNYVLRNLYLWDAGEGPVKTTVLPGVLDLYCDDGLIEDCVIGYTTTGMRSVVEGIDLIASARTVIRNCDFINAKAKKQVGYGFFVKGNGEDTVVDNCYFQNCDIGLSFGDGLCPWDYSRYLQEHPEHRRGIMKNNVVHGTYDVGIYLTEATDFKCYNNTVWSTYRSGSSIDFRYLQTTGTCYNNISSQSYRLRDGATPTLSNNLWNAPASLFVNQAGTDYHLVSTATQAIDQGLDTTADVPYDMDGETRPKGSAVDIGADEY